MSDKMTPEIRFRGFSDDWEQRRLGEVFDQTSNLVNPREEHIELWSLTVARGLTPKTDRYNREFLVKKDDQFKTVANNEFIYNPMNMTLGASDLNLMGKTVAVSGYYITMISKDGYESNYFNIWLKSEIAIKKYKIYATGSLIERQRIQFPTLSKIKVLVPNLQEQEKIGTLFNRLDNTIALHQQKLDQLSKMKISLLQDIFPTDGQNRPKIRFTYFYDIWEKRKLSSKIISELKGKARREMIGNGSEYLDTIHLNGGESQKVNSPSNVTKEDIIILWDGSKAGTIYHGFSGALGSTLKSYKIKGSSSFLYQYLKKYQHLIYENYRTPNIPHVNKNFTNEFYIYETKNEEENKIGKLLNNIDVIVDLHQQKIDKLQQIKKAYLQKMFI